VEYHITANIPLACKILQPINPQKGWIESKNQMLADEIFYQPDQSLIKSEENPLNQGVD
jgi:hypothetical protein